MAKPKFLYDNRLGDGLPVASSTAAGTFSVLNLLDWRPYTWWQPAALPATVTVDCGAVKAADFALVYGHNLWTQSATLEIHGSTDNFAASDVLVATSAPASDLPLLLTFNSASFRYWRFKLTGAFAPSLAIVAIGAALVSTVYMQDTFSPVDRTVEGQTNRNENGHPLGRAVYFETWKATLLLPSVSWSWARNTFLPAWKSNLRGSPFGFCWDSDLFPEDVRLVQAGDELQIPHRAGSFCDVQLDVQGIAP